jgi:hypothetical protein
MFSRTRAPSKLEIEIDRAIRELRNHAVGSTEYVRAIDQIVKLHEMKENEKPKSVSKDTLAIIGANLLGIILIIRHEHVNVISSKAMNMVIKPR